MKYIFFILQEIKVQNNLAHIPLPENDFQNAQVFRPVMQRVQDCDF